MRIGMVCWRLLVMLGAQAAWLPMVAAEDRAAAGVTLPVERLLNYPFETPRDLATVAAAARILRPTDPELWGTIAAFADPAPEGAERVYIESFARSGDEAIRRLRDEIRLDPPPGGVVVRIYRSRMDMPSAIWRLFKQDIAGINIFCRYVAVLRENRSETQFQDTVSHELAHAYINSVLGPERQEDLPRWFQEGVAQYLAHCEDLYITHLDPYTQLSSYSPADYREFGAVFRYLEAKHGRTTVNAFIREAVQKGKVESLLSTMMMVDSYKTLSAEALRWDARREWLRPGFWIFVGVVAGCALLWWLVGYFAGRERGGVMEKEPTGTDETESPARSWQAEADPETLEDRAFDALEFAAMALDRGDVDTAVRLINEALRLAPWSEDVCEEANDLVERME